MNYTIEISCYKMRKVSEWREPQFGFADTQRSIWKNEQNFWYAFLSIKIRKLTQIPLKNISKVHFAAVGTFGGISRKALSITLVQACLVDQTRSLA